MSDAIGQIITFGVGVGLSPIPIIGVTLVLATTRARTNGPAFLAGWVAGLTALGAGVLLLAGGADPSDGGQPAEWVGALKVVLGIALILLSAKQWRGRPQPGEQAELPGWMRTVDSFTPTKSLGLGVALSALNPKNLILVLGAATAIAQTGAPTGDQAVALAVFVLIGTIGVGLPIVFYFGMGDRSKVFLDDIRGWMAHNNEAIMAVICLVIGAKLLGDGITIL